MNAIAPHTETLREAVDHGARPPGAQPAIASKSHPDEAMAGQGVGAFPDALVSLAAEHVATLRLFSPFDGLLDLIERVETECARPPSGEGDIAGHMLDGLVDLRITLEARIQRLGEKAALAEAETLDQDMAELSAAEQDTEITHLRPAQRAALVWARARAIAATNSLLRVAGKDD